MNTRITDETILKQAQKYHVPVVIHYYDKIMECDERSPIDNVINYVREFCKEHNINKEDCYFVVSNRDAHDPEKHWRDWDECASDALFVHGEFNRAIEDVQTDIAIAKKEIRDRKQAEKTARTEKEIAEYNRLKAKYEK